MEPNEYEEQIRLHLAAIARRAAGPEVVDALLAHARVVRSPASVDGAVRAARLLREHDRLEHEATLVRALRSGADTLIRRPAMALPLAEEAVTLARGLGGPSLVVSLATLSRVLRAAGRTAEAEAAEAEAESLS
ncbi:hypothetical protein [Herbidospora cretacea]|uniref:hypothetical protein n=1 Tax=Herbidospora cretacea TaxID=28444 RepID=UPI0004C400C8|nr:hypothetical protein [Herbidospora cretacea]